MGDRRVDGVSLRTEAWNVTTLGGLMQVPGKRGSNTVLPGVHGTLYVPNKVYDEGSILLAMWVLGCDPAGLIPTSLKRSTIMRRHARNLSRIFGKSGLLLVEEDLDNGDGTVECYAEVVQAYDFTTMAGATRAEFAVEMVVPASFWQDQSNTVQTVATGAPGQYDLTALAGATAPLTGLTYGLKGPAVNPVITNPVTGQWVRLGRSLTGTETWNLTEFTSKAGATNVLALTTHGGGRTWLDLTPRTTGASVNLAGVSSGATLTVTGRRKFLIP